MELQHQLQHHRQRGHGPLTVSLHLQQTAHDRYLLVEHAAEPLPIIAITAIAVTAAALLSLLYLLPLFPLSSRLVSLLMALCDPGEEELVVPPGALVVGLRVDSVLNYRELPLHDVPWTVTQFLYVYATVVEGGVVREVLVYLLAREAELLLRITAYLHHEASVAPAVEVALVLHEEETA